ncbi:NHL repeat-containing protein [bacterium]|nr:NHL repeat-containing protein [bacterium]
MPHLFALLLPLMIVQLGIGLPFFGGGKDKAAEYEQEHTAWVYPPWEHTWGVVRATETHLDVFTLGKATFRNPQGLAAVRLTATDDPDSKGDDDEVTVYGINSGENAIIYNRSMRSIGLFGYDDETRDFLDEPWDIAALPNGLVFVTDSGHRRVVKFRNVDGELVFQSEFGRDGQGALVLPRGIDVTVGGLVVVADAGADRVVLYDTSGVFVKAIGGFDRPVGLAAVDSLDIHTRPKRNYFAVTDSGGQRLRRVDFDGHILAEKDISLIQGERDTYAGHIEIDLYHNIAATDSTNDRLLKFDENLELLSVWGQTGEGRTRFHSPTGIAIWRRFGQAFVAESRGAHYLWVGTDISTPPRLAFPGPGQIRVGLDLTERSQITLEIVDDDGKVLRTRNSYRDPGSRSVLWRYDRATFVRPEPEGRVQIERPGTLPEGEYTLRIRLRATYSSRKAFERVMETSVQLSGN